MRRSFLSLLTCSIIAGSGFAAVADDSVSFVDSVSNIQNWKGSAEGGLDVYKGNTESTNLYLRGGIAHEVGRWEHSLGVDFLNREEVTTRTAEKYSAGWESKYAIDDRWFAFGDLNWVKDRFSGYDYRIGETVGVGHIIHDDEKWYWDVQSGIGMEHTKTDTGMKEDSFLAKIATDFHYNFNENVEFIQYAEYRYTSPLQTMISDTSIKSKLSDTMAVRAGYRLERLSDVPTTNKKTDSHTYLGVVYDF